MEQKETKEEWVECPTCGGLTKDITNTEIGQKLKEVIEESD